MFETNNTSRREIMAITSMQAIKVRKAPTEDGRQTQNGSETQGSTGQSLTMGQAEKMLKSLVEEKWFEKSQKGYYSLSPRALMELRGWLLETYNDVEEEEEEETAPKRIKQCFACKEIITAVGKTVVQGTIHRLILSAGPTMSEAVLLMPTTRYMYAKLLPNSKIEDMPSMRDGVDRQRLCGRDSGRRYEIETEEKRKRSGCESSDFNCRGRGRGRRRS
jgi:hypothetical protein